MKLQTKKTIAGLIIILVALITIIGLSGLNFIVPQTTLIDTEQRDNANDNQREPKITEKMFLTAKDNKKIATDLYKVNNPIGWLVLIHMMPAAKESWLNFAQDMQNSDYESLTIDLRGHGQSDGGPDGYQNFSDQEHQMSILDVEAAVNYLKQQGAESDKIILAGASIGANLALQYISEHPEIKTAILFSPGLNYRGIATEPLVKKLQAGQKVFFISAKDDIRSGGNNAEMNQKLYDLTPAGVEKKIQIYETGGHGTDILKNQPALETIIKDFIR